MAGAYIFPYPHSPVWSLDCTAQTHCPDVFVVPFEQTLLEGYVLLHLSQTCRADAYRFSEPEHKCQHFKRQAACQEDHQLR